jgi:DNA-binding FadR family transcriptional regulator
VAALAGIADRGAPGASAAEFLDADLALHRRILELSGNEAIATLVQAISPPALHARIVGVAPTPGVRAAIYDDHTRIVQALADHDVDAARAAVAVHVTGMRRQLREVLAAAA